MKTRNTEAIAIGLVALAAIIVPPLLPVGSMFFLTELLTGILFAVAVNLLLGFTGLVSFGQAAYYGIGAYAVAMLIRATSTNLLVPAILFGAIVAAVAALILGAIALRATGVAFSMLTLAFAQMFFLFALTQTHITGGENGIPGIIRSPGALGFIDLSNPLFYYYFCLVIIGASLAFLRLLVASPFGYALRIIREDPKRAEFLGIPVKRYQLASFVFSGFFSGLAGGFFVFLVGLASSEMLFWSKSGDPIIMSLLGGLHTFWGPGIGAVIYLTLIKQISTMTTGWMAYVGVLLLFLVLVLPEGILGVPARIRLLRWRREHKTEAERLGITATSSVEDSSTEVIGEVAR
ncbi:MAG TPA: branched-chain amino acid ABC transporter permease [Dehalococcoidia bacterium]|nr:branched-chain amino acid ABC transporter permease [Dehalococcoidia bacterium]